MPNATNIELIDATYIIFIIQYEFNSDNNYTKYCCREYDPFTLDENDNIMFLLCILLWQYFAQVSVVQHCVLNLL